jgi:hypothetical protein
VQGRAHFGGSLFLAFYYNQAKGTQAFTLVRNEGRHWGIDYDNQRGWHEHPLGQAELHIILEGQTIASIIQRLKDAIPGAVPGDK